MKKTSLNNERQPGDKLKRNNGENKLDNRKRKEEEKAFVFAKT